MGRILLSFSDNNNRSSSNRKSSTRKSKKKSASKKSASNKFDNFVPSKYQKGVRDFVYNENGSCIVDAKAGSGKTTLIEWIVNSLDPVVDGKKRYVTILAFNKSIEKELSSRMPKWVNVCTFHSAGFRAWAKHIGGRVNVDGQKIRSICDKIMDREERIVYAYHVKRLVSLAKNSGIGSEFLDDTDDAWTGLIYHHALMLDDNVDIDKLIFWCRKVLAESNRMGKAVIDFDDMLYLPLINNVPFFKNDMIFVDEAQDTNMVQVSLLFRMLKRTGRIFFVGDPCQAIYGFRGADSDSINNIQEKFNAVKLPLSISYRCSKSVIHKAQEIVPDIEAWDQSPEGQVEFLESYTDSDFVDGDAILCRNTAPLISFCYSLLAKDKAARVLGRKIGQGLISLIKKFKTEDVGLMLEKLDEWQQNQIQSLMKSKSEHKIESVNDKADCIRIFADNLVEEDFTVSGLIRKIESVFTDNDSEGIVLATCHRSKGHEWDRVFILDSHLMPSRWARRDWQKQQEKNLEYVAITRAKSYLGYINSGHWSESNSKELSDGN